MDSTRLLRIVIVVAAALLLFATQLDLSAPRSREPLPEDVPALLGNRALDAAATGIGATARRAALDPAAAWDPGGAVVGRTRFRPAAVALFVVERAQGGSGALALVLLVSLALHVLTALGVVGLVRDLGGSRAALWTAGLLVACAPAALSVVAWPARQPAVLAAALGIGGLRLALRRSTAARVTGGVLLAVAFLAHELALGLAAAALVLSFARRTASDRRFGATALALAAPVALAMVARWAALAALDAVPGDGVVAALPGAVAGVWTALLAPLLPTHLHLIGEPWTVAPWVGAVGCVALLVAALLLARRVHRPVAALWLAALAAAAPVAAAVWTGGTPFHHGYAYMVLPLVASAAGLTLATAAARGGALRVAAAAAGALLLGASVAGTLSAAPRFRSRADFVELAARGAPRSMIVEAWRVGDAAAGAPDAGTERGRLLLAELPRARAIAARLADPSGAATPLARALRRDGPAALGVSAALAGYARRLAATAADDLPNGALVLLPDLEAVAEAAAAVAPDWDGAWLVLAQARALVGADSAALEAAQRAAALAPGDVERHELVARLALSVGRTDVALQHMLAATLIEDEAAAREGRPPRRAHLMLHAEALAADASTSGLLVEFDWALREILPLFDEGDRGTDLRGLLYDIHLRWGDALASLDRTAPARIAYTRAVQLGGTGSEAAEHLGWLEDRLREELRRAQAELDRAAAGEGNVANALLALAVVRCRLGEWETADQIFTKIEEGQGGMNAALRFTRAVHRYAAREDQLDVAERELRLVLDEDPSLLEARFRLAGVLVELGRVEEAAEAYRRAAREGAAEEWAVEAIEEARRLEAVLARPSR